MHLEYSIICLVALFTSALTLFSGFGLGTLLLPAFAVFFPTEVAVALTAIVHFLNNLFKLGMLGKYANREIVFKFGGAAILAAFAGAKSLLWLANLPALYQYRLFSNTLEVLPVNLVIGLLMIIFAALELSPNLKSFNIQRRHLIAGGVLSGFFGGVSGHQGALRTMFLIRTGLSKESFIATGVVIACLVDVIRLAVYSERFVSGGVGENTGLLIAATLSAFSGAYLGRRLMHKVTMRHVRLLVSLMLILMAIALMSGMI